MGLCAWKLATLMTFVQVDFRHDFARQFRFGQNEVIFWLVWALRVTITRRFSALARAALQLGRRTYYGDADLTVAHDGDGLPLREVSVSKVFR